jgi:hypothetical protein
VKRNQGSPVIVLSTMFALTPLSILIEFISEEGSLELNLNNMFVVRKLNISTNDGGGLRVGLVTGGLLVGLVGDEGGGFFGGFPFPTQVSSSSSEPSAQSLTPLHAKTLSIHAPYEHLNTLV